MNRSIKVSNEVYQGLLGLQRPRETLSGVVGRLLQCHDLLIKAEPILHEANDRVTLERLRAATATAEK